MESSGSAGTPRVVVVTGASAGMGMAAALKFAALGDRVIAGVRNEDRAAPLTAAAAAAGLEIETVAMDVCDDAQVAAAFEDIHARHGEVDVLVANAGTGALGTLEELTMDAIREAMEVNFYGVVRVAKAVLPRMRRRGSGRIIVVTSVGGVIGQPFTDAYCAAKGAAENLCESLQPVAARFGVRVSIVEPGPVASEFHGKSTGIGRTALDVVDNPYGDLWAQQAAMMAAGESRKQSVDDAAQVIVDVAGEAEPKLRYQTSNFTRRLVGMKLADLDGSVVTGFTSGWFKA